MIQFSFTSIETEDRVDLWQRNVFFFSIIYFYGIKILCKKMITTASHSPNNPFHFQCKEDSSEP